MHSPFGKSSPFWHWRSHFTTIRHKSKSVAHAILMLFCLYKLLCNSYQLRVMVEFVRTVFPTTKLAREIILSSFRKLLPFWQWRGHLTTIRHKSKFVAYAILMLFCLYKLLCNSYQLGVIVKFVSTVFHYQNHEFWDLIIDICYEHILLPSIQYSKTVFWNNVNQYMIEQWYMGG